MKDPARVHRRSRWISVRAVAFALRHGLDEAELMRALSQAYRCDHCGPAWRMGILEDAQARNLARSWRKMGRPWRTPRG